VNRGNMGEGASYGLVPSPLSSGPVLEEDTMAKVKGFVIDRCTHGDRFRVEDLPLGYVGEACDMCDSLYVLEWLCFGCKWCESREGEATLVIRYILTLWERGGAINVH